MGNLYKTRKKMLFFLAKILKNELTYYDNLCTIENDCIKLIAIAIFLEEKNKCFSDVKRVNIAKLIV